MMTQYSFCDKSLFMNDTSYQRFSVGTKFFIHAPPFSGRISKKTGEYISKRLARIQPPFVGAEPWQHSIYYFWWEFLRRHEGYKDYCARGGAGRYKKLYAHFGDVHAYETKDFWSWWTEKPDNDWKRGEFLFAEPAARQMAVQGKVFNTQPDDMLVVSIPLEVRTPQLVKKLRSLLDEHKVQVAAARNKSRALYPVAARVRLSTLHQTLKVWDIWNEDKHHKYKYEQAELAGIPVNRVVNGETVDGLKRADLRYHDVEQEVRRRQNMAFRRYLTAAKDYIDNVGKGHFPLRNKL
jgi:hypothetical protein